MRVIGLDISPWVPPEGRLEDDAWSGSAGSTSSGTGWRFAGSLTSNDHVVIEATGNAAAVAEVLRPHVGRVIVANPKQVRLIAHAKIKTDRIDAVVLAQLYASGFLPEV